MSAYIQKLNIIATAQAAAEAQSERAPTLTRRVAMIVGDRETARIPDLQRMLDVDAKSIGTALRELGFRRKRVWTGDAYALTRWHRSTQTAECLRANDDH